MLSDILSGNESSLDSEISNEIIQDSVGATKLWCKNQPPGKVGLYAINLLKLKVSFSMVPQRMSPQVMPNAQYFEKTGNKFRVLVTQSAEVNVIKPLPPYAIKKWNA